MFKITLTMDSISTPDLVTTSVVRVSACILAVSKSSLWKKEVSRMIILIILFSILLGVLGALIYYGRKNYGTLENCGFPVIQPTLFLGSDPQFYKEVQHLQDIERYKKYGPIWGLYLGQTPQVFVCDPELIRLILVKDYDHFHNRREVDFGSHLVNEVLDYLPGEKWRTVRSMLSPLFTTAKLKSMTSVIEAHAREYAEDLKLECGDRGRIKYDCKIRLTAWLIDMFAQSTLGIQLQNRKDPDNQFALAFRKLMGEDMSYGRLYSLTMSFPFLTTLAPSFDNSPAELLESTFRSILESRSRSDAGTKKSNDFVDVLNEIRGRVETPEFQKLGISELTVIAQAVNFFLGGYETSSTTISHFFFYLAKHPQIQEELYKEVSLKFGSTGATIDHESLKEENTPYLTACLKETLRLAPPLKPERICTKDWTHDGIRIRKGMEVYIATWPAHRNPDIFPDPEEFKPERFLADNRAELNQYAFTTFGHGPRNCIGMRFAFDSIKTFLVHFLLNFRIEMRVDTVLNYKKGSLLLVTFDPLYVDVVLRQGE